MSDGEKVSLGAEDVGKIELPPRTGTEDIDKEIARLQAAKEAIIGSLRELWVQRDVILKEEALAADLKMMREKHGMEFSPGPPAQDLRISGIASKPGVGNAAA